MEFKDQCPNGFALIAALMAIWILTAVGILVFTLSTQDIRISGRLVGEKKAFSAAESGIHILSQTLNPADLSGYPISAQVDPTNDPDSRYTINAITPPAPGQPTFLPMAGYAMGGGQQWGQLRFNTEVEGTNTRYNSMVRIAVGVGYGPIEITTVYR